MGFRIFRDHHANPKRVWGVIAILRRVRSAGRWCIGSDCPRVMSYDAEAVMYVYGRKDDPVLYRAPSSTIKENRRDRGKLQT